MSKEEQQIQDEFSQDWLVYKVVTHETKQCQLWELDRYLTIKDLYKMAEICDVYDAARKMADDRRIAEQNKK
jgi:hypothetical protein